MPDLDINFQFVANAQSLKSAGSPITTMGDQFARMITDEVALAASKSNYNRVRNAFLSQMRNILRAEVSRMAMLIGRYHALPDKYTHPNGRMSAAGGVSATARAMGMHNMSMDRASANIQWRKRHPEYLAWKKRKGTSGKWWKHTGELQRDLASKTGRFYEQTFGPVRVRFVRPAAIRIPKGQKGAGRFTRAPNVLRTAAVEPGSGFARNRGTFNVTAPSGSGKVSAEYTVGTLEVDFFNKITPQMLPGLAEGMDPTKAAPSSGDGVVGLFPDGETKMKLLEDYKGKHKRWSIEPFVSFFLMRSMPNAVWRRTEQLFTGSVEAKGGKGLGAQFGSSESRSSY